MSSDIVVSIDTDSRSVRTPTPFARSVFEKTVAFRNRNRSGPNGRVSFFLRPSSPRVPPSIPAQLLSWKSASRSGVRSARARTRPQIGQIELLSSCSPFPSPRPPFIALFRSSPLHLFSPWLGCAVHALPVDARARTLSLLLPSSRVFVVRNSKGYIARGKCRARRCWPFSLKKVRSTPDFIAARRGASRRLDATPFVPYRS